jgi:hypothetical protein
MTKMEREKTQINKIKLEKGDITTNNNETKRIITEYFEKSYSRKLENPDKMNKFLDAYEQPKLNQEDINHLNRPIASNEIEAVIKSLSTQKSPRPDEFMAEFYQTFKEQLIPILLKFFQEIEREGTFPNLFYESHLFQNPIKMQQQQQKELYTTIFNEYRCKDS